jgi:hypothetical protein
MSHTEFRIATPQDTTLILDFIKGLAEYEKMSDQVVADEALLHEWIFEKKKALSVQNVQDGSLNVPALTALKKRTAECFSIASAAAKSWRSSM